PRASAQMRPGRSARMRGASVSRAAASSALAAAVPATGFQRQTKVIPPDVKGEISAGVPSRRVRLDPDLHGLDVVGAPAAVVPPAILRELRAGGEPDGGERR